MAAAVLVIAYCSTRLQATALFEAVVATISNDDVVEYLHAEQRAGINQTTSQHDVIRAGARVATGMVVRQDDGRRVCQQRHLEHLADGQASRRACHG
jgi:hypothetical protein